jgi:LmbE family N-acetylglucosaminyl deacetylase
VSQQAETVAKVAMVITAHPDDAEFGAGGTLAAWAREGWEIYYVICSDGSGGGSDDAREVSLAARQEISRIRQHEQHAACEATGGKDVFFLGYPDGQLEPNLNLRRDIVRMLRKYRPTRVVCQSPERTWTPAMRLARHHPDHLAAGEATLAAVYPASQNPWDFPELLQEGLEPHRVKEVYVAGSPNDNFVVDITETIDVKLKALAAHASQLSNFEETEKWVRSWSAATGQPHGLAHAEAFHRVEN